MIADLNWTKDTFTKSLDLLENAAHQAFVDAGNAGRASLVFECLA